MDEQAAREGSTRNAFKEFDSLCSRDQACLKKEVEIVPKRSECNKIINEYDCRRLFEITITERQRTNPVASSGLKNNGPKIIIYKGNSKVELISDFGVP
ncbi:hypothetical protein K2X05_12960, partial [bacterium]|nr:hypothetical protein [bacterium]